MTQHKELLLLICLISLAVSQSCKAQTQSSCVADLSCSWNNGTCSGGFSCLEGFKYVGNVSSCVNCLTLAASNCSVICPQYYFSTANSSCVLCTNVDPFCLSCNSTVCFSCASGYTPDAQHPAQCLIDACKIRHCRTCLSSSTCAICKTGYTPSNDGSFCSLASCAIASCLFCVSSSSCVTCLSGYKLSADGSVCNLICKDVNCLSCSTYSTCSKCPAGYSYNTASGYCKLLCTVPNCNDCDLSTTCTECANGYAVSASLTSCIPICTDANCRACSSPSVCTECNSGYYLSNATCIRAICFISRCTSCSSSTKCGQCDSISTLSSNGKVCTENCLAKIKNCNACATNDTCSSCDPGYQLSSNATSCNIICTLQNCVTCLTSSTCTFCAAGYIVSSDSLSCLFNCGILNCATCGSATTCSTCTGAYTLTDNARSCRLLCSPGFFVNTTTVACQSCSLSLSACRSCELVNVTLICSKCVDLYYLTANGACSLCSSAISNCLLCLDSANCSSCNTSYTLVYSSEKNAYVCIIPYSCNVSNCKQCSSSNSLVCLDCNSGYYLSSGACALIECLDTQYYDTATSTCVCPAGSYLRNKKCQYCNAGNCISCNSAGCVACRTKFYAEEGECRPCTGNCKSCTSSSSCLECETGFTVRSGSCVVATTGGSTVVGNTTTVASCPPGCSKCSYFDGAISCTKAKDGYAIDQSGELVRCDDSCATCAETNSKVCTSCFGSSALVSGACVSCEDDNAVECPSNNGFTTKCLVGYANIRGVCKACAANCLSCGLAGANKCDDGGCSDGYIKIVGTSNCTKCFSSCATCSTNNPSICLSCGTSSFLSNTSTCVTCTTPCLSCSSAAVCTSCLYNYNLEGGWCYARIGFPCAAQTKDTCTSCYLGYDLVAGNCVADTSCNGTSTCSTCDKYFYLKSKKCFPCKTSNDVCEYCDPKSPSACLSCVDGYYVRSSTKACVLCSAAMVGCSECTNPRVCNVAQSGYYIEVDNWGDQTGKVKQCASVCSTCSDGISCDTCAANYNRVGTTCIYSKNLQTKFTLGAGEGSKGWFNDNNSAETNLANAFMNLNQLINAILSAAKITNQKRMIVTGLSFGSLVMESTVAADPNENFADFSSSFTKDTASVPDFTVVSQSIVVNGQTSTQSTTNSALILGIAIPLVVLLVIIIVVLKIKLSQEEGQESQESKGQIQSDFDI